jgi:NADPH:quinone reductase-like Zn-dependent oxidoreductase
MRAVALEHAGDELAIADVPAPRVRPDELLVRVVTSSINPIDVRVSTGRYPWGEYVYPVVPGFDFAGVVDAVGEKVTRFAPGDAVLGYWRDERFHRGAWADYVTVREDEFVARKPRGMSFEQAAALPLAGATAVLMLDACAPVAGETVLVVGAGGAVGGYVVQLAARAGATVIATARPGHEERLRALGAREIVDYTSEDVVTAVRARHPQNVGALVDLPNGRREVARLAELVRDGGRVASACFGADVSTLATRGVVATNVAANACDPGIVARIAAMVERDQLVVGYDGVCALAEVPEAVREIAAGASRKTVIRVSDE